NATMSQDGVSLALGPVGTTYREVYRTALGSTQLQFVAPVPHNTTLLYLDVAADSGRGANAPAGDTSGLAQPTGQVNAGSTSLLTASPAPFSATGGWALVGSVPVRYTGITGNTLTGIPASGPGALTTTVL